MRGPTLTEPPRNVFGAGFAHDFSRIPVHATRVIETAERGTSDNAEPFPFLDRIQPAFGRHDIGSAGVHTGSRAASAARAIGARAFTFGDRVAFDGAPDLHTAAHEAAHVVQQHAGVQTKGAAGEPGDAYERHAD